MNFICPLSFFLHHVFAPRVSIAVFVGPYFLLVHDHELLVQIGYCTYSSQYTSSRNLKSSLCSSFVKLLFVALTCIPCKCSPSRHDNSWICVSDWWSRINTTMSFSSLAPFFTLHSRRTRIDRTGPNIFFVLDDVLFKLFEYVDRLKQVLNTDAVYRLVVLFDCRMSLQHNAVVCLLPFWFDFCCSFVCCSIACVKYFDLFSNDPFEINICLLC